MSQLRKLSGPARMIRVPWRRAATVTAGAVLAAAAVLAGTPKTTPVAG